MRQPIYLTGPAGTYQLADGSLIVFSGTGIVWCPAKAAELVALGLTCTDVPPAAPEVQETAQPVVVEDDATGDELAVLTPEAAAATAAETETTDPPADVMTTATLQGQAASGPKRGGRRK